MDADFDNPENEVTESVSDEEAKDKEKDSKVNNNINNHKNIFQPTSTSSYTFYNPCKQPIIEEEISICGSSEEENQQEIERG